MSYSKADQLMQLATLASSRHLGISLDHVRDEFGVSHRTAQRMMRALENQFPEVETLKDADGRKLWRIKEIAFKDQINLQAEEIASLKLGIQHLERAGLLAESRHLQALQDKVNALIPRSRLRLEADYDAILEAQGFTARPGPRPKINEHVHAVLIEAIKSCRYVHFEYRSTQDESSKPRYVAPYGFLSGIRRYVVAADPQDKRGSVIKTYRLDVIEKVSIADQYFERPKDFDLQSFANRAFGVFQRESEFEEIIWRFTPEAAPHAAGYLFHPNQTETQEPDGSLTISFKASGQLEMAWHLYTWGDKVDVIAPASLRQLVSSFKRGDFPAMP